MILTEPYPVEESPRCQVLISILLALFVFLFLFIFQPFGLSSCTLPKKELKLLGFSLITLGACLSRFFFLPKIFSTYFESRNWTVGKEFLSMLMLIMSISLGNYMYTKQFGPLPSMPNLSEMLLETLLIGIFPITGLITSKYIYQLLKYKSIAESAPIALKSQTWEDNQPLVLLSDKESDKLCIIVRDFIFMEAKANYVEIHYYKEGNLLKKRLRSTLNRMQEQIQVQIRGSKLIQKCHRSFIINLSQVISVKGNAQGYRFQIRDKTLEVPVGGKYKESVQLWKNQ